MKKRFGAELHLRARFPGVLLPQYEGRTILAPTMGEIVGALESSANSPAFVQDWLRRKIAANPEPVILEGLITPHLKALLRTRVAAVPLWLSRLIALAFRLIVSAIPADCVERFICERKNDHVARLHGDLWPPGQPARVFEVVAPHAPPAGSLFALSRGSCAV